MKEKPNLDNPTVGDLRDAYKAVMKREISATPEVEPVEVEADEVPAEVGLGGNMDTPEVKGGSLPESTEETALRFQEEINALKTEINELNTIVQKSEAMKRFGEEHGFDKNETYTFIENKVKENEDKIRGLEQVGKNKKETGVSVEEKRVEEVTAEETVGPQQEKSPTHEGREEEFTQRIFEAQTFSDLYTVLREIDVIKGTKTHTAEDVIEGIEQLREQVVRTADDTTLTKEQADGIFQGLMNLPLNEFTRRYGLRDVVKELLAVEYYGRFPKPPILTEVEGVQEKAQQEEGWIEKEIDQVIESVPEKERPSFMRRIISAGLFVQEKKNAAFAGAYGWAANKYTKEGEKETGIGRFFKAAQENYTHATEVSKKQKEDIYENKVGVGKSSLELLRSGALIMRAVDPFKWFKPFRAAAAGLMVLGRYGDITKEARLKNTEALEEKSRIQSEDEAMEEALGLYTRLDTEVGERTVSSDQLTRAYLENLPTYLGDRMEKSGVAGFMVNFGVGASIHKIERKLEGIRSDQKISAEEKESKINILLEKHGAYLKYLDRVVSDTGTMDLIAETGRRAGLWSKRIATVLAIETALEGVHNIVDWFKTAPEDIAVGHGINVGPQDEIMYSKDATGAGTAGITEIIKSAHEGSSQVESGVFEYAPHPEIIDIEKGGNIWNSAKELGERFHLNDKAFGEAWSHSVATLADGREIPIAELNLVHEGDILEYVPGENGAAGHFEFSNASALRYGDVLNASATESASIEHEQVVGEVERVQDTVEYPGENLPHEGIENSAEQSVGNEVSLADRVNAVGIEKYAQGEVDKELQWFFGQNYVHTDMWADIKDMSARKFEKMKLNPEGENMKLSEFKSHLIELGKKAGIRPRGGIFRREESIEDFFIRVRRLITEQSLAKKGGVI